MLTTPNGTEYTLTEFTPEGGSLSTWAAPTDKIAAQEPINMLLHCHGSSGTNTSFANLTSWAAFRNRLIDSGWGWIESHAYDPAWGAADNNWGSPTGVLHYRLAYEYVAQQLPIDHLAIQGRSMGGIASINLYLKDPIVSQAASALILNCATQDLTYRMMEGFRPDQRYEMRIPYGYSTNEAMYDDLPNIDPMLYPLEMWEGKKVLQVVADADTSVPPHLHGLPMRLRTHHTLALSGLSVAYGGTHGANGGYRMVDDMMTFLNEALYGPQGRITSVLSDFDGIREPVDEIRANINGQIETLIPTAARLPNQVPALYEPGTYEG